jgi:hypothetical protein
MGILDFRMFRHDGKVTLANGNVPVPIHHQCVIPRNATPHSTIVGVVPLTHGIRVLLPTQSCSRQSSASILYDKLRTQLERANKGLDGAGTCLWRSSDVS